MPMQENQPAWLAGEVRMAGILVPQMLMEMLGPLRDQSRRENRGLPVARQDSHIRSPGLDRSPCRDVTGPRGACS